MAARVKPIGVTCIPLGDVKIDRTISIDVSSMPVDSDLVIAVVERLHPVVINLQVPRLAIRD